ncbi:MAG: hypothetical protein IKO16_09425 [Lachnospiraceae bacterium]|nr:hypothetical protein [Lachnospiraceae bacterium]
MKTNPFKMKHIMLAVMFAIYMAEYMVSLICMDNSVYGLEASGEAIHYLKMPALALGFLLFPLSQQLLSTIKSRRIILGIINVIFLVGMALLMGLFFEPGLVVTLAANTVSLVSLGFIGGAVYYYYSMGLADHPYMGRLGGVAGTSAFLLQMVISSLGLVNWAILLLLLAGFAFIAYLTIGSQERFEWMFDEPLEYARKGDPSLPDSRAIIAGIAGMIILYMICGLTDTIILSINFAGDMSIYAWPRLFGAVGYLVGGFLSDIGHRRWLMIFALCMSILSIPLPFILKSGYIIAGTCLYYIIAVSLLMFLNVFFWDLAPKTSHPHLISGMSRVIACLTAVILPLFSGVPIMADLIIEVLLAILVVLCIASGGYVPAVSHKENYSIKEGTAGPDQAAENAEKLDKFAQTHGLTPREKDFLIPLIESDDEIQVIASNMNISTRTVYRHINSIYEKTGTETRYALMRYFYQTK